MNAEQIAALEKAKAAVRAAQETLTNQEQTYAQLDDMIFALEDIIESGKE